MPVRVRCLCAGVGPGSGSSRVRFQEVLEQDGVPVHKSGVGTEVPSGAQVDSGKTQRDKILEAVEVIGTRSLFPGGGFDSGSYSPAPNVSPHSPTELERAQQFAKLLEEKARLEKKIQGEEEQVVSKAEDDLSFSQQE